MSHDLIVHIEAGSTWKEIKCDDIEEGESGLHLYEGSEELELVGYVPYNNLAFVTQNR